MPAEHSNDGTRRLAVFLCLVLVLVSLAFGGLSASADDGHARPHSGSSAAQTFGSEKIGSCCEGMITYPAVTSWGPNRLDAFVVHTDGKLEHDWQQNSPFSTESWGGDFSADTRPVAVSWGQSRLDVFTIGRDQTLWHHWKDGGSGVHGESWGGVWDPRQSITATTLGPWRLDIFLVGYNKQLYHYWQPAPPGQMFGLESLGGTWDRPPAAVSQEPGRLDVFIVGQDNKLYHYSQPGPPGRSFRLESLGGSWGIVEAATTWGRGRLDVFVSSMGSAATGSLVHHLWQQGGGPFGDEDLRISSVWNLTAVSRRPGRLDIFTNAMDATGSGLGLVHLWQDNSPFHMERIEPRCTPNCTGMKAVSWGPGRLDLFASGIPVDPPGTGTSQRLTHYWQGQ